MLGATAKYLHKVSDFHCNGLKKDEEYSLRFYWDANNVSLHYGGMDTGYIRLRAFNSDIQGINGTITDIAYFTINEFLNDWDIVGDVIMTSNPSPSYLSIENGFMNSLNREVKLNKLLGC